MKPLRTITAVISTASLLIGAFAFAPAASAGSGATAVTGRQVAATGAECAGASYVMSGDLEGCWTTDTFELVFARPNGIIVGRGTETFVGCIDSRCGSMSFTFVFVGRFDAAGAELWGGCHHPITGGTGDFAGARGELNFVDDVDGSGLPPADYRGRVTWGS